MVDLALPRELNALGQRAVGEALSRRASTVEAEHVLLAILARENAPAAGTLLDHGLGYLDLGRALDAERARSLGAAGVAPISLAALAATPRSAKPRWGASSREILRRANKPAARDDRPGALELELAIAILDAELGTVPRALLLAGIDRIALLSAIGGGLTLGE